MATPEVKQLHDVIATNLALAMHERGWQVDHLALAMLASTSISAAEIRLVLDGSRPLSAGELLAICGAIGVPLADLIEAGSSWVVLGDEKPIPGEWLLEAVLTGKPFDDPFGGERRTRAHRREIRARAAQKVAKQLGVPVKEIESASTALFGLSFVDARDERAWQAWLSEPREVDPETGLVPINAGRLRTLRRLATRDVAVQLRQHLIDVGVL